ncbi:MAG: hypothetical protein ACTSYB_15300 [Candidatus Helarchaeota archaeon]
MARANLLFLIKPYAIIIPLEVKKEVVDKGIEQGCSDSIIIENEIKKGCINVINIKIKPQFDKIAQIAGLHRAEIAVIYYAYKNNLTALLDEDAARDFALGLGIKIKSSLGLLIDGLKNRIISPDEAKKGLNALSQIMYLSSDIYRVILEKIEKFL